MLRNKPLLSIAIFSFLVLCRCNQNESNNDDAQLYEGTVRAYLDVESPQTPVSLPEVLSNKLRIQAKIAKLVGQFEADVNESLQSENNYSKEAVAAVNAILNQAKTVRAMCYPNYAEREIADTSEYVANVTDQYRLLGDMVQKLPTDFEKARRAHHLDDQLKD